MRESSAVFDDLDRQEQLIGAPGQTTTFAYDTLIRLTSIQDADGNTTQYQYDDRDRLRFVTDTRGEDGLFFAFFFVAVDLNRRSDLKRACTARRVDYRDVIHTKKKVAVKAKPKISTSKATSSWRAL